MLDKSTLSQPVTDNPTLKPEEVKKFDTLAKEWWDESGKMKSALAFNKARFAYIQNQICKHFGREQQSDRPLQGLTLLDVGSGGGLLSEPLAQAGANVLGIDASAVSVEVAKRHAVQTQTDNVDYQHMLSNDVVELGKTFDVVINAEVVEHVGDQQQLIKECCQLVKPGGMLILATLNKTIKSFIVAIVGAEYVMRYLPIGTHDWRYFVKPEQLNAWAHQHGCELTAQTGMALNPLSGKWRYTSDMSVNYCLCLKKLG
jgi:2-polyprenyl-6-hydroxyphenyl methylase/3-demethylubiquinone-9 3-methyltransferase